MLKRTKTRDIQLVNRSTMRSRKIMRAIARQEIAHVSEVKWFGTVDNGQAISQTAFLHDLCLVPQGDADTNRDGDRLNAKVIHWRHFTYCNTDRDIYRIIWFLWKPNSVPTASALLLNGSTGSIDVSSAYNHDNRSEYKILKDKQWVTCSNSGTYTTPDSPNTITKFVTNIRIPKRYANMQYVAGGTTGTNHVYSLMISRSTGGNSASIYSTAKLMFTDL